MFVSGWSLYLLDGEAYLPELLIVNDLRPTILYSNQFEDYPTSLLIGLSMPESRQIDLLCLKIKTCYPIFTKASWTVHFKCQV